MDLNEVVCSCFQVTNGMIKEAVEAGANTLEEVQDATNAGNACGVCLDQIKEAVSAFVAERSK